MGNTGPPSDRDGFVDRDGSDIDLDLGFGKFVSSQSRKRLLNRDGTFNVRRTGLGFFERVSVYHFLLEISWPRFLALAAVSYTFANAAFAAVFFVLGPEALDGLEPRSALVAFSEAFFFSVHTFATIGYGDVTPATWQADLVVTLESLVGLLSFGLAAGLIFARFARPNARIIFSRNAVIAPYRGERLSSSGSSTAVSIRSLRSPHASSWRGAPRTEVGVPTTISPSSGTGWPFFPLSRTIVHPIDDSSPLAGLSLEDLKASDAEFPVLLTGFDQTFAQTVHSRSSYEADEVVYGQRFVSMFDHDDRVGLLGVDLARIHDVLPTPLGRSGDS